MILQSRRKRGGEDQNSVVNEYEDGVLCKVINTYSAVSAFISFGKSRFLPSLTGKSFCRQQQQARESFS